MVQRYRRSFTNAERTEMWDRWQRGESLRAIGRTFGKPSSWSAIAPWWDTSATPSSLKVGVNTVRT
ncbi:MAG: hypothetical protein ACKVIF_05040 [Rhodospirillales bacterium]|jgi:hypothetical protein